MDPLDESCWDFLDYGFLGDSISPDFSWAEFSGHQETNNPCDGLLSQGQASMEKEHTQKRVGNGITKACREKLRRERLNDKFNDLSSVLEPGRPAKTDKPAILDDAIRILNQLRAEAQEFKEENEKLLEEIKTLKAEKHELRDEKLSLKADKEKMEQKLKAMAVPPGGFVPTHPAAYHAGSASNKMAVFPSYGYIPMWHYLPPSARDTSRDHELRPPAA